MFGTTQTGGAAMSSIARQQFDAELVRSQPLLRSAARGLCARQPNAEDTAQDILQDTNLRALECRDQFCGGSVAGWLYALMRNLFHDYLRKQGRTRKRETLHADLPRVEDRSNSKEDEWQEYDAYPDAHDSHAKLEAGQVVEAIGNLPDRTASALLQAGVGATSTEIAASLGLSEANVRKLLERGRLTLRLTLEMPSSPVGG
jgi:RNA polymerase sigma factor (sigma-70 family)